MWVFTFCISVYLCSQRESVCLDCISTSESAFDKNRASVKRGETGSGLRVVETVHWRACLAAPAPLSNPSNTTEAAPSVLSLLPPFTPFTLSYLLLNIHSRDSETWKKSNSAPPLLTAKYIPQILLHPYSKQRCSCFLPLLYPLLSCPFLVCVQQSCVYRCVKGARCFTVTGEIWTTGHLPQAYPHFVPAQISLCLYSIIFREVVCGHI